MNVVCFGDSNTWGYNPHARFGEKYDRCWTDILAEKTGWNVINQGVNGREVPDSAIQIDADIDLFLVMLGTNDLLQLDSPEATVDRMEKCLLGSDTGKIVLISPPPMVWGEWVQDQELIDDSLRLSILYEALAIKMGIRFFDAGKWNIPLCFDGVHFSQEGQYLFAEKLSQAILS